MNKIRHRIAFLAGSSVIITIMTVMVIFNFTIKNKTEHDACNALNSLKSSYIINGINNASIYNPETIMIENEEDAESQSFIYTKKEKSIIDWYNANPSDDIKMTNIGGSTYYLLYLDKDDIDTNTLYTFGTYIYKDIDDSDDNNVSYSEISLTYDDSVASILAYVDITGEMKMIKQIDLFFILTAVLIGTLSTVSGYFIGRRLEQNQLAQKQFFENTSHELKTPLAAIQGYAEGIEKGVITDMKKSGRIITAQTNKMSRMIEEILCIARIESGALRLEKEEIILDELLQDCLMPFEGTIGNKKLDVRLELSPVRVSADAEKLEHAVSNLLINALKYAETFISISCDKNKICISNDCPPISDDTMKHIFERFYTGRDGNTGIGLALAKEIIELHGWNISAMRIDGGVMFIISDMQKHC